MGAAWLWVLYNIHLRGRFYLYESPTTVLWAETILLIAITGFGIYTFIQAIRRR